MSRFADPARTETVSLGPCDCPGTPHGEDKAVVRTSLGGSALARIGRAELQSAVTNDHFASYRQLILEATESWTLLWEDPGANGKRNVVAVPINEGTIELLDEKTLRSLAEQIDKFTDPARAAPNDSAAPSRGSRQVRRSRTRTSTPKPGT